MIFGYLFIKKKVRALRWLTEASPSGAKNIGSIHAGEGRIYVAPQHFKHSRKGTEINPIAIGSV
ncbi:hypothetical protein ASE74_19985 [Pedobacter sp. Leaf216]|nr:hypothetical protein ASE74_19985 [Pedobacter sp. Leaf216]